MSIIYNGTTIPNNGDYMVYNGTNLDKVVYNGATVWEKETEILIVNNGTLQSTNYIKSCSKEIVVPHGGEEESWSGTLTSGNTFSCNTSGNYMNEVTGQGCYTTNGIWCYEDCTCMCTGDIVLKIDSSLIGKQCTIIGDMSYTARYWGPSAYIKNGNTSLWSVDELIINITGITYPTSISKTFTLTSDTLSFHVEFRNDNDQWCPHGSINISSIVIE